MMGDERERFVAQSDWRHSNHLEASRWSGKVMRRSFLGSDFRPVPLQGTSGAYRTVNPGGDVDEPGFGVSNSTSTLSTELPAKNGEKCAARAISAVASAETGERRPHIFLNWWKELLACILFIAAFLALFATVYAYDNQPSPSWPNWISLNTIISIYAIFMEIGVVCVAAEGLGQLKWSWFAGESRPLDDLVKYDDATRGPLGALRLLWRLRAREFLSSFGALIVTLALGLSPFAQQVIRYHDCTIPINETSRIPRTNYYKESGGFHIGAGQENIMPGVQRSVLAGIFSPSKSPDVTCSTGNCTWSKEYSTVGFCSACEDISNQLVILNHTFQHTQIYQGEYSNGTLYNDTETTPSWNLTVAVLGSDGTHGVNVNQTDPEDYFNGATEYAAMGPPPEGFTYTGPYMASYFDFVVVTKADRSGGSTIPINPGTGRPFPGCDSTISKNTWPCRGYGGSRCTLYPCVQTLTASMAAGKLTETLNSTTANWNSGSTEVPNPSLVMSMLNVECLTSYEVRSLTNLGYNITSGQRWLAYNATFDVSTWHSNDTFPESMMNRGCLYAFEDIFISSMAMWLPSLFLGTVSGGIPAAEKSLAGQFSGSQVVQSFSNFGSSDFDWVDQTFSNISTSLTNYIRQNGIANFSSPAIGETNETRTCIKVQWPFLIYPASLAILALSFFLIMVLATRPTGLRPRVWKSSPLALLYHGLVGWDENTPSTIRIEDKKGMEEAAKSTAVKLNNDYGIVTHLEVKSRIVR